MNAEQILDEIEDIVQDPSFGRGGDILPKVNRAQLILANRYLLTGLADGNDTVTTSTSGSSVALPSDYHKGLFMALVDGKEVEIARELKSISTRFNGLSTDTGDVIIVAAAGGRLVYQQVPDVATDIDLYYYRPPVDMTDSASSFPDGISNNEDFDNALIQYACWQLFEKIEHGVEGQKVNTAYHKKNFYEACDAIKLYCYREGENIASPPPVNKAWN